MIWIRRCLALGHLGLGLAVLLSGASYTALVITGLPQLSRDAPGTSLLGAALFATTMAFVPLVGCGAWLMVLARWLWSGHRRLRTALLVTHGFLLLLGSLGVVVGLQAVDAAERSTARGGGLLSPLAFLPFLFAVPLLAFALCSIAAALRVIPASPPPGHGG